MLQDNEDKLENCFKKTIKAMERIAKFENLIIKGFKNTLIFKEKLYFQLIPLKDLDNTLK